MRRSRGSAGVATVAILVLVLVVAVVLGDRTPSADGERPGAGVPALTPSGATSAAWYCAAGTSDEGGRATETVRIANLDDEPVEAVVTVLAGRDEEPGVVTVEVAARSTYSLLVGDVLATPDPGVLVETFGGETFVEHEMRGEDDVTGGPCADAAAAEWYFGAGSTAQGAEQHLELFNPFGDDASVDISFVTETGYAQPERLQGFTVPRHSRVSLPVHDEISRADLVATRVLVRTGRAVAQQTLVLDGSETVGGRAGLASSLGATAVSREWVFPWGGIPGGTSDGIAVANFGTESGELTVSIALDGEATLEDQTVPLPPRTVTFLDVSTRVPAELGASVVLRASPGTEVVAEQIVADGGGLATMVGMTATADRWVLGTSEETIALYNPSDDPVEVVVRAADGEELATVEIAGGDRAEIGSGDMEDADAPILVDASGPVVVARVGSLAVAPAVVGR